METEREIGKRLYQIGGRWRDKRDCNARADAVACGTAVSAVASGPPCRPALAARAGGFGVGRIGGPTGSSVP